MLSTHEELCDYISSHAQQQLNKILPMNTKIAIVRHYERGSYIVMLASHGKPLRDHKLVSPPPVMLKAGNGKNYVGSWESRYRFTEDGMIGKVEFIFSANRCDLFD